jgi:HK97 gp10 family phage protein
MAPVVTTRILGDVELGRRLRELADRAAEDALVAAGIAGGLVVERTWKTLFRHASEASIAGLPPRRQTGQYAQSIHVEVLERSRSRVVVAIGTSITDPPYPVFLEYGTSRMPAHPIARPAFDQSKAEATEEMTRELRRRLGM